MFFMFLGNSEAVLWLGEKLTNMAEKNVPERFENRSGTFLKSIPIIF